VRKTELAVTVATLQRALDAAQQRIREQEQNGAEMNRRYVEVQAQRDELEMRLLDQDAETRRRE
jgi:hypothetical protein